MFMLTPDKILKFPEKIVIESTLLKVKETES